MCCCLPGLQTKSREAEALLIEHPSSAMGKSTSGSPGSREGALGLGSNSFDSA